MRHMRLAGLLATVLAAMVIAACSSGGGESSPQPDDTTSSTMSHAEATTAPVSSTAAPVEPQFDIDALLRQDGVVLLNVLPPLDDGPDSVFPDGMFDYDRVFRSEGEWEEARQHVDIYRVHAWQLRYALTDDQIRTMVAYLDEHDIALMLETEPLTFSPTYGCDHTESFSGIHDLEMVQRLYDLGGTLHAIAIEEPYHFVHKLDGPRNCQWTVERIVDGVIGYVAQIRELYPAIPVGTIEPIWSSPATTPRDMEIWLDTWQERSGESFAFLHIDPDWYHEQWPEIALGIEAVADARDVPFGVLYNGGVEPDNESWMQFTMENVALFEQEYGGTPQHVSFQSWVDLPDRALPPTDLGALTSGIVRYFGEPTKLSVTSQTDGDDASELIAMVATLDGAPVTDAEVALRGRSLAGGLGTRTVTGTVPEGVTEAVALVRVNIEGAGPAPVDARVASISYREDGGPELIVNSNFDNGTSGWGVYGPAPGTVRRGAQDGENWLEIQASADEQVFVDGQPFPVTPGATYEFTMRFGLDEASTPGIDVAIEFPDVARIQMDMTPPSTDLGTLLTGADGTAPLPTQALEPGVYELELDYDGDLNYWPTEESVIIEIR